MLSLKRAETITENIKGMCFGYYLCLKNSIVAVSSEDILLFLLKLKHFIGVIKIHIVENLFYITIYNYTINFFNIFLGEISNFFLSVNVIHYPLAINNDKLPKSFSDNVQRGVQECRKKITAIME